MLFGRYKDNLFSLPNPVSPAPKANEGLVKAKFYTEMANAKNAPALGVRVNAVVLLLGFLITVVKEECGLVTFFGQ